MFIEVSSLSKALFILILVKLFFLFLITTTIYYYFYSSPNLGHSFIQQNERQEYYSLLTWNTPNAVQVDLDGDGVQDLVTLDLCVFISSLSSIQIPGGLQCAEPATSRVVFPDRDSMIGQKISPRVPFRFEWLRYSYLVRDWNDTWYLYDINGLEIRKYELLATGLFEEVNPTRLDRIDVVTYQITHLGVALSVVGTYFVKHFHFIATK